MAQHTITEEKIVYCNICGAGWYVDAYGEIGARKQAEACYEKHKEAGNMDETARQTFFSTGGDFGYIQVIQKRICRQGVIKFDGTGIL